jgi:hypothetical protein
MSVSLVEVQVAPPGRTCTSTETPYFLLYNFEVELGKETIMTEPVEVEEDVDGVPSLLKLTQVQGVYQNVMEIDPEGNITDVKMQANAGFKTGLNKLVHDLILDCIEYARSQGRKMLTEEDVPNLDHSTVDSE